MRSDRERDLAEWEDDLVRRTQELDERSERLRLLEEEVNSRKNKAVRSRLRERSKENVALKKERRELREKNEILEDRNTALQIKIGAYEHLTKGTRTTTPLSTLLLLASLSTRKGVLFTDRELQYVHRIYEFFGMDVPEVLKHV